MYLSRLILNPRSRLVQRDIAKPYEMHRTLWRAIAPNDQEKANDDSRLLYRIDLEPHSGVPTVMMQSATQPDWRFLNEDQWVNYLSANSGSGSNPQTKPLIQLYGAIASGQILRFRLRANVTKKIHPETENCPRGNGKRVALRQPDQQVRWLKNKGEQGGFELVPLEPTFYDPSEPNQPRYRLQIQPEDDSSRKDKDGKVWRWGSVLFEGILRVTDDRVFRDTLSSGIGSAKAFGFGLLSIAPV